MAWSTGGYSAGISGKSSRFSLGRCRPGLYQLLYSAFCVAFCGVACDTDLFSSCSVLHKDGAQHHGLVHPCSGCGLRPEHGSESLGISVVFTELPDASTFELMEASPHIVIAPVLIKDLEEISDIEGRVFPDPWSKNMFLQELMHPEASSFKAVVDQKLAGYAFFASHLG